MKRHIAAALALCLPAASLLAAPQESAAELAPPSLSVDRNRLYISQGDDATWIRGATYKAQVSPTGFTYVPFLGSAAPKSFPVTFRLDSAALGGTPLELTQRAGVSANGQRYVLDRGAVDVIYDVEVESVEQSFAVDAAGSNVDLSLTLSVETELSASADGAGFRFAGDYGGMTYGAATVLDGAGRKAAVPAELHDGSITLTVPAAFLRSATGTVVVDPLFSTFTVDDATAVSQDADVAYDLSNDAFIYVFEDAFSGSDTDIYSVVVTPDGVELDRGYAILGGDSYADPSVAGLNSANQALVVAQKVNAVNGFVSIIGSFYDFDTETFSSGLMQISPESLIPSAIRPDVGGNSMLGTGGSYAVVWEADFTSDSDVHSLTVQPDGTLGSIQFLSSGPDDDATRPAISKSTGDPAVYGMWNVAFIVEDRSSGEFSAQAAQLNASGSVAVPVSEVYVADSGIEIGELDVSDAIATPGTAPTYAIAIDLYQTAVEDTTILFVRNGSPINVVDLQRSEHADVLRNQGEARLATTRDEFVVTYLEAQPGGTGFDVYATSFDFTEGQFLSISERRTLLGEITGTGLLAESGAPMASRFSGGLLSSRYIGVGWDSGVFPATDIAGATFNPSNPYSPAFQYCYGNANSTGDRGFIRLEGDRTTTNGKTMVASSLPPNSFGYFVCGDGFAEVQNPGGSAGVLCVGGVIGRYSNQVTSSGALGTIRVPFDPQAISQPNGAVAAISGQFWQFSLWHRDSVSGTASSNFTNAVSILFE